MSYPEHDRLHLIKDKSQAIADFLDWLYETEGVFLSHKTMVTDEKWCSAPGCAAGFIVHLDATSSRRVESECETCKGTGYVEYEATKDLPYNVSKQKMLADFFSIDLELLEEEKVAMLEEQRRLNEQ